MSQIENLIRRGTGPWAQFSISKWFLCWQPTQSTQYADCKQDIVVTLLHRRHKSGLNVICSRPFMRILWFIFYKYLEALFPCPISELIHSYMYEESYRKSIYLCPNSSSYIQWGCKSVGSHVTCMRQNYRNYRQCGRGKDGPTYL